LIKQPTLEGQRPSSEPKAEATKDFGALARTYQLDSVTEPKEKAALKGSHYQITNMR
jgi:hypothetical protein